MLYFITRQPFKPFLTAKTAVFYVKASCFISRFLYVRYRLLHFRPIRNLPLSQAYTFLGCGKALPPGLYMLHAVNGQKGNCTAGATSQCYFLCNILRWGYMTLNMFKRQKY